MGEINKGLENLRGAIGLFDDLLGEVVEFAVLIFIANYLCKTSDASYRVADLVRHPCGEAANRGQTLTVGQPCLENLCFGHILHENNETLLNAVTGFAALFDKRLV